MNCIRGHGRAEARTQFLQLTRLSSHLTGEASRVAFLFFSACQPCLVAQAVGFR